MRVLKQIISNRYFILGLRLLLGVVFIYASIDKIDKPGGFAQAIYNYRMMPHATINLMAMVMPWLELMCGILIIIGLLVRGSALLIGFMLLVFIVAISFALVRGLDISCGCFKVEGGHTLALGLLVRDILMFISAALVVAFGGPSFSLRRHERNP
ncbi:MAG TPA: MauE/DoxX family redox-associated membrane protein [bacterium]|nr:MauE/DoxX family redox-associated membrane protein [bacterium]